MGRMLEYNDRAEPIPLFLDHRGMVGGCLRNIYHNDGYSQMTSSHSIKNLRTRISPRTKTRAIPSNDSILNETLHSLTSPQS